MSGIMKALLLLTVLVCFSRAQYHSSQTCLCGKTQGLRGINVTHIKDFHLYPQTVHCSKVEIVVNLVNGKRICLNPKKQPVKLLMDRMLAQGSSSTVAQ